MSDLPSAGPPDPPSKPPPGGDTRQSPGADVKERVEKPRLFKVLLHNDDYTTMEFVVEILMNVFHRSRVESTRVMLLIHNSGKGVAGVYSKEIAEAKADLAIDRARSAGYPLLATTEPE
jgi:ATP-dependent Clp protease adaptor protein ClpS